MNRLKHRALDAAPILAAGLASSAIGIGFDIPLASIAGGALIGAAPFVALGLWSLASVKARALDALCALSWRIAGPMYAPPRREPSSMPVRSLILIPAAAGIAALMTALWWLPVLIWELLP